jgi:glycerophosphoryl diester phosphodiesterase
MTEAARPLTVAHRAGNHLDRLRAAQRVGVDLVEADVWLYRGRLEARHFKTLGPIPVLWDRWALAAPWTRRLALAEVLRAAGRETELMLDIKSSTGKLPQALTAELEAVASGRRYTVSSQQWHQLAALEDQPNARIVYSVGSERMLRDLPDALSEHRVDGIAIHRELLDEERAARLRELAPLLFSWAVNDEATLERLLGWGVNGVIVDDLELLQAIHQRADG